MQTVSLLPRLCFQKVEQGAPLHELFTLIESYLLKDEDLLYYMISCCRSLRDHAHESVRDLFDRLLDVIENPPDIFCISLPDMEKIFHEVILRETKIRGLQPSRLFAEVPYLKALHHLIYTKDLFQVALAWCESQKMTYANAHEVKHKLVDILATVFAQSG